MRLSWKSTKEAFTVIGFLATVGQLWQIGTWLIEHEVPGWAAVGIVAVATIATLSTIAVVGALQAWWEEK